MALARGFLLTEMTSVHSRVPGSGWGLGTGQVYRFMLVRDRHMGLFLGSRNAGRADEVPIDVLLFSGLTFGCL